MSLTLTRKSNESSTRGISQPIGQHLPRYTIRSHADNTTSRWYRIEVIVCGLHNVAVCNSGYTGSNDQIINDNDLERIWKEWIVVYMEVEFSHLPQGTARKQRRNFNQVSWYPRPWRTPSPEGKFSWPPLELRVPWRQVHWLLTQ